MYDREFIRICDEQVLKLKRRLYLTCDANDYWTLTLDRQINNELGMDALDRDRSLYIHQDGEGILGQYVDDGFMAGDEKFQVIENSFLSTQAACAERNEFE